MPKATQREAIATAGEVFPDGKMLELIRPDPGAGELRLLSWDGKNATVGKQFKVNGKIYRPASLNRTSLSALRLPANAAPYGTTRDLFNGLCALFAEYADIPENDVWQVAYLILGSFLTERLLAAPFLSLTALFGAPRTQMIRLLSCLCWRTLKLVDVTPTAICKLANLIPTFLFDEPNLSRRAERFLYTTNSGGAVALGNGHISDVVSAKIICSREPLRDALLASQALQITLSPGSRQIPFLEDSVCASIASEFQAKLLQYRLENLGRIRTPDLDVSELSVPLQDVARSIASCVVDDRELQLGVVQFLRGRDLHGYLDSATELGSAVLEGLLFCCHRTESQVLCGELADIVNTVWRKRGEGLETTPEKVGWKLRALGLRTEPIDGAGKGVRFTEGVRLRIHSLAKSYGVPSLPHSARENCPHCKATFGKQVSQDDGTK
jgi:hypothetical protein